MPREAGIEVLTADGAGRYDVHPPTWRLGMAQTLTREFGPLACFAGRDSYFSARSRVERLEAVAGQLRGACARGELAASACALADAHRDAIRRDFAAAYPGLADPSHPPTARRLPFGRALVPLWSALRRRPLAATLSSAVEEAAVPRPRQGVELADGTLALVEAYALPAANGTTATRSSLVLLSPEGEVRTAVALDEPGDAVVAALPSAGAGSPAFAAVTADALTLFDAHGARVGRAPVVPPFAATPPRPGLLPRAVAIHDAVARPGPAPAALSLIVAADDTLVELGLDGRRRSARPFAAREVHLAPAGRLWVVEQAPTAGDCGVVVAPDGTRRQGDLGRGETARYRVVRIADDLGSVEAPEVMFVGVASLLPRADGFEALVHGGDGMTDGGELLPPAVRGLVARFDLGGALRASRDVSHPELGSAPWRFVRPSPSSNRRVVLPSPLGRRGPPVDTGVDLLELNGP